MIVRLAVMPAFGSLLTDEEIRAMVVCIRETAGKAKAAGARLVPAAAGTSPSAGRSK
jgi:mono/diheme cytochrome c family protein